MKVHTKQLEILFQKVISKLSEDGIDCIELSQDMYWFLSNKDSYAVRFAVENPLLGSFVDDWENLKRVSDNSQITTYVDFERLASILKAISEELNPE